jgi:hypothetical protein
MNEAAFLTVVSDDFSYLEPDHFRDVPRYALPQESALSSVQPVASRSSAPPQAVKNPSDVYGKYTQHKQDDGSVIRFYSNGGVSYSDHNTDWTYYDPGSEEAAFYNDNKEIFTGKKSESSRKEKRAGEEDIGETGNDKKKRDSRSGKKAGVFGAFLGSFAKGFLKSDDTPDEEPSDTGGGGGSEAGMDSTTIALVAVGGVVLLGGVVFLATRK